MPRKPHLVGPARCRRRALPVSTSVVPVVFMNEIDMKQRGIEPGALVKIESPVDDGEKRVVRGFLARLFDRRLLPGNQSIAPVGLPRCQKQNSGGEIDPGAGQAIVRKVPLVPVQPVELRGVMCDGIET